MRIVKTLIIVLYIFWFLHQTTTDGYRLCRAASCISFDSYIKPQLPVTLEVFWTVVYLLIPTSNHNYFLCWFGYLVLYIFWFLHQTTTWRRNLGSQSSCISFDSYIKPQPVWDSISPFWVVYLLIPTSNHNYVWRSSKSVQLYIFWFLHQTTTWGRFVFDLFWLYIFWFLHQTTTLNIQQNEWSLLYIFWFLHQTTTIGMQTQYRCGCISFDSYIKPQLVASSLRRPTGCISFYSYIKPQRSDFASIHPRSCISFDSYIKPQRLWILPIFRHVVYLLIPTSNHNL